MLERLHVCCSLFRGSFASGLALSAAHFHGSHVLSGGAPRCIFPISSPVSNSLFLRCGSHGSGSSHEHERRSCPACARAWMRDLQGWSAGSTDQGGACREQGGATHRASPLPAARGTRPRGATLFLSITSISCRRGTCQRCLRCSNTRKASRSCSGYLKVLQMLQRAGGPDFRGSVVFHV